MDNNQKSQNKSKSNVKSEWVNNVGSVRKGEYGNFLSFHKDVEIKKGYIAKLEPYQESLDKRLERGFISQEQHDELTRSPDYKLKTGDEMYVIHIQKKAPYVKK